MVALALIAVAAALYLSAHYLDERQNLAAAGDTEGAMEKAELAARLNPFSPRPLIAESNLLQAQGRDQAAAGSLREAARRDPANYRPHMLLGNLQASELNDPEAAAESYREALEHNPRATAVIPDLASVLIRQGKLEEAARQYEKLRGMGRLSLSGKYDLGRIYVRTGSPQKGLGILKAAERQTQRQIRRRSGEQEKAQARESKRAIGLAIANAYVVQGRYGEARQMLTNSTSEQAPAILELLNSNPQGYRQSVLESELYQ